MGMHVCSREDCVVATKATGPSGQMAWIRGGPPALDRQGISAAIEGSLRRLGTDSIDLYQLHWPDRHAPRTDHPFHDPQIHTVPWNQPRA